MPHTTTESSPRRAKLTENINIRDQKHRPPSVTINAPVGEVYAFLRDFENYGKFMRGIKAVAVLSERSAQFTFDHQGSPDLCDVERTEHISDQRVSWRSLGDPRFAHTGAFAIEAAPGNRGAVVSLDLSYDKDTPGKLLGVLSYFTGGDPKNESYVNLRRLKAYLETGEVPTVQGQPNGRDL